ncbi:MAG TPA: YerC/YecD family TrpR-related protein [Acidimicrobiia bacterium]
MALPNDDWRNQDTRTLFEAILRLEEVEEAAAFFRDLCTRREIEEMSHRWAIARLLDEGLPYREIAERTGASTTTITRINQWLAHGTGGYRMMLDRTKGAP